PGADTDRMAVGFGACRTCDADGRAAAGYVFDDQRLAERRAHVLAEYARQRVSRSSGRERHDDRGRAGRKVLGAGRTRPGTQRARSECDEPASLHQWPEWPCGSWRTLDYRRRIVMACDTFPQRPPVVASGFRTRFGCGNLFPGEIVPR